jgi:Ca2+-binding EF-hand superfamily protein
VKETERIEVEQQIKLLFELWDSDHSGTIEIDELARGLIAIGLGGTIDFTKKVLYCSLNTHSLLDHL